MGTWMREDMPETRWVELGERRVSVPEGDAPCVLSVRFSDPRELDREFFFSLNGREIACITVEYEDGKKERFVRTFYNESCEVLD